MLEDELSDADLKWLKSHAGEGPQDEEWCEYTLLKNSLENWGKDFEKEEALECQCPWFNFYFFAEDIRENRVVKPNYYVALFRADNLNGKYFETLINLNDFRKKPIITFGMLKLVFGEMSNNLGFFRSYFNEVPKSFSKDKNYRSLYEFEKIDVIP